MIGFNLISQRRYTIWISELNGKWFNVTVTRSSCFSTCWKKYDRKLRLSSTLASSWIELFFNVTVTWCRVRKGAIHDNILSLGFYYLRDTFFKILMFFFIYNYKCILMFANFMELFSRIQIVNLSCCTFAMLISYMLTFE